MIGKATPTTPSNFTITLENNDINTIKFVESADGQTYPPSEFEALKDPDKYLNGFIWREKERPLTKEAIFIHDLIDNENVKKKTTGN